MESILAHVVKSFWEAPTKELDRIVSFTLDKQFHDFPSKAVYYTAMASKRNIYPTFRSIVMTKMWSVISGVSYLLLGDVQTFPENMITAIIAASSNAHKQMAMRQACLARSASHQVAGRIP